MKVEESVNFFYEKAQYLDDKIASKLQEALQKSSCRYVVIDFDNGSLTELDSAALRIEEIRRIHGRAGKNTFETMRCMQMLAERVKKIHPSRLLGMFTVFVEFSGEPDIANIRDENKVREIAQKFRNFFNDREIVGETNRLLSDGNQQWHISFKPGSIEVEMEDINEPLFPDEEVSVKEEPPRAFREPTVEETKAAIKIQKVVRGHIERKAFLPRSLFPQYQQQYEDVKTSPKAINGKTKVYFPKGMPGVVFKESGENCAKRFKQMLEVRKILSSQKSTHLVIPEARRYQEFLVERRLPINESLACNMKTYCLMPELFNDAVREMTRLFSRALLTDLVSSQKNFSNDVVGDSVRYDNIPLYIEEGTGKIGLIDLIHIQLLSGKPRLGAFALATLARIFPFHLDIIIDEAKKLGVRWLDPSVRAAAATGRKYLEEGYLNHYNWLLIKGALPRIEVAPGRLHELEQAVAAELLLMNQGVTKLFTRVDIDEEPPKDFLVGKPEESAKKLAAYFTPVILKMLNKEIDLHVQTLGPEADLVHTRTVTLKVFEKRVLCYDTGLTIQAIGNYIKENDSPNDYFCNTMICAVLEKLKEKEIFAFNPGTSNSMSLRF